MKAIIPALKQLDVYETRHCVFVTGYDVRYGGYRVLEIPRPAHGTLPPIDLNCNPLLYSSHTLNEYLSSRQVNVASTSAKLVSSGYCLYGFVRLLESYYLIVVTNAHPVASIHGHVIYAVADTITIPITYKARKTIEETRYRSMIAATDFSRGHYFSYSYDLTSSLQRNHTASGDGSSGSSPGMLLPQDMFVWNRNALLPLLEARTSSQRDGKAPHFDNIHHQKDRFSHENALLSGEHRSSVSLSPDSHAEGSTTRDLPSNSWVVALIFGFLEQKAMRLEDGHLLKYTLIARRSRHFAGTRYLRRGVNNSGFVANEVESEQIVTIESGIFNLARSCSMVQLRGSIPLYWCHVNIFAPSPDIRLESTDPSYRAARAHFNHLTRRYGEHVTVLNLVRQKDGGREVKLGRAFGACCAALNHDLHLAVDNESKPKFSLSALPQYALEQLVTGFGIISLSGSGHADPAHFALTGDDDGSDTEDNSLYEPPQACAEPFGASNGAPPSLPVSYLAFDLLDAHHHHDAPSVFDTIAEIGKAVYPETGFFVQPPFGKEGYLTFPLQTNDCKVGIDLSLSVLSVDGGLSSSSEAGAHEAVRAKVGTSTHTHSPPRADTSQSWPGSPGETTAGESGTRQSCHMELRTMVPAIAFPVAIGADPSVSSSSGSRDDASPVLKESRAPASPADLGLDVDSCEHGANKGVGGHTTGPGVPTGLLQRGILRTNCIDCLDRTNIGQFTYAKVVLPCQLRSLGVHLSPAGMADVLLIAMEAWARHGDEIAMQYGGSGAMHRVDVRQADNGDSELAMTGGLSNGVVAVNRYYSNVTADAEKQQAIDLLLGEFEPRRGFPASWEQDLGPTSQRGPPVSETAVFSPSCGDLQPLELPCVSQTPFFSEEHVDKHSLTSFRAVCDSSLEHVTIGNLPLHPLPQLCSSHGQAEVGQSALLSVEPVGANAGGDGLLSLAPISIAELSEEDTVLLKVYLGDHSNRSEDCLQIYQQCVHAQLLELPSAPASPAEVALAPRPQTFISEHKERVLRWRRSRKDPLHGTEASLGEQVRVNDHDEQSYRERLVVLPGFQLDAANEVWIEGPAGAVNIDSITSFPTYGARSGRRSKIQSHDDEAQSIPEASSPHSLLSLGNLVAGAGAGLEFLPSTDSIAALSPWQFISGYIFRSAVEKKLAD